MFETAPAPAAGRFAWHRCDILSGHEDNVESSPRTRLELPVVKASPTVAQQQWSRLNIGGRNVPGDPQPLIFDAQIGRFIDPCNSPTPIMRHLRMRKHPS